MLDRVAIEAAFEDLADSLESTDADVKVRIYVAGGAAMVLIYDARAATEDVDGDFYSTELVQNKAREVARRRDLPEDWLSDAAKVFLPQGGREPRWTPVLKRRSVEIATIDPEALLAMKIRASRPRRDGSDIAFLCGRLGIESAEEALALYEEFFPQDPPPNHSRGLLADVLGSEGGG
jgi:hypothetical protein